MYLRILFTALVNSLFIPIVKAATNFAECCVRVPVPDDLKPYQWDACYGSYNKSEFHPLRRFSPPILSTLDWCRQNCADNGMFQISDTNQWLSPFSSWVIPAVTMLFLCPISEHLLPSQLKARDRWRKWLDELVFNWLDAVIEYIQILGDPASAYDGALTMMMNDLTLCMCLKRPANNEREKALITTVILSEQVDIEAKIVRVTFQILSGLDKAQDYSQTACRTMYAARKKFHMAVTLPVAFYIGIAAAIFYDANQKLGDNDTAYVTLTFHRVIVLIIGTDIALHTVFCTTGSSSFRSIPTASPPTFPLRLSAAVSKSSFEAWWRTTPGQRPRSWAGTNL
jgi:hypothetical protein